MEVSTFELLIKPIAPRSGLPVNVQSGLRRVVQGYFLTISNLEDQDLRFRIEFIDSVPNPANTNRQLSINPRNVDLLFDIAGDNEALIPPSVIFQGGEFGGSFTLPARQTASIQLLPSLTPFIPVALSQPTPLPSPLNNPNPDLEIRGFVRLRLPANVSFIPGTGIVQEPQAERPVKVLLQPEIRGTFLPNNFPTQAAGDFDQISYSLVTASGKALNEIEPEGLLAINSELITSTLQRLEAERGLNLERLEKMGELDQVVMIIESLSQLDTSSENLEQVSNLLSQANIPIRMSAV